MPLPAVAQQTINDIIQVCQPETTELRRAMIEELTEQLESLISRGIIDNLPPDQGQKFQEANSQGDLAALDQIISNNHLNIDKIIHKAAEKLGAVYLDPHYA